MRGRFNMHYLLGALLCVVSLFGVSTFAGEIPYQATVNRDQAPLRCGPAESYYNTANLTAGTIVEVYQEGADGWCAIRPPAESFSLIPSTQTRLADGESLAEVTSKQAVSWVGSATEDIAQLLWQVQLHEGEVVEIVGIVRRENLEGTGKDLWYKIRPPAGEFRYMRVDDLTPTPEAITAESVQQVAHLEQVAVPAVATRPETSPAAEEAPSQWRVRTNPRARAGEEFAGGEAIAIPEPTRVASLAGSQRSETPPKRPSSVNLTANSPPAPLGPLSNDPDTLLNQLDVELSLMAAQPVARWEFALFERKLEQLNQLETNTKQRTRMVRFRNRLEPFQKLHAKHADMAALAPSVETASPAIANESEASSPPVVTASPSMVPGTPLAQSVGTGLALAAPPPGPVVEPSEEIDSQLPPAEDIPTEYDGVGYLMPVISREQQAPPFALLDKNGKVLGFVSPVPGLNLRRYVKQEVGVVGQRGYLPKYQATHLTAQRIIVLDRHR